MSNFCNQGGNGNGFASLQVIEESGQKSGCGCKAGGPNYEPLTANWFRNNAGIIAIVVTVLLFVTGRK